MKPLSLAALLLPAISAATAFADVQLPAIFGDHMVLQRDGAVPVWGTADPGESVCVTAGTARGTATAGPDGKWMVRLGGLSVSPDPIEMVVEGKNRIVLQDVLVGDVWICSGQSNMEFGIRNDASSAQEIADADHPKIRLFFVPKSPQPQPVSDLSAKGIASQARWLVCSPATVVKNGWGGFSAAGYFFGRDIHAFTGAPVGLIGTYWGGTPIWTWTSLEAFQKAPDPALKQFATKGAAHASDLAHDDLRYDQTVLPQWKEASEKWKQENAAAWTAYQDALQQWNAKQTPAKPRDPSPPMPLRPSEDPNLPTVLFNGMIFPLVPYAIKGVVWYQGEANTGEPDLYATLLPTLIRDWRAQWNEGDFPFLIVQLANFAARKPEPSESHMAALRESQAKALALPNTGLAVAIDLGETDTIHPTDKVDVGARLALAARKVAYGDAAVVSSGPTFKAMSIEGSTVRVSFDSGSVGQGLAIGVPPPHFHPGAPRPDATVLRGFSLAGPDSKFYWADARIEADGVTLSSPAVPDPRQVRYAWADNPDCNLYNLDGLPAVPFRAGGP